jgi:2Fe-2S ferredoxin
MVTVRFIQHDGTERVVEGRVGDSIMQTARDNLVAGILGDCGGNCSCATCHGYVEPDWFPNLEPRSEDEEIILEGAMDTENNSRLTCQIKLRPELDGIVVRLPVSQT